MLLNTLMFRILVQIQHEAIHGYACCASDPALCLQESAGYESHAHMDQIPRVFISVHVLFF